MKCLNFIKYSLGTISISVNETVEVLSKTRFRKSNEIHQMREKFGIPAKLSPEIALVDTDIGNFE